MPTYFFVAASEARDIVTGVTRSIEGVFEVLENGTSDWRSINRIVFAQAFDSLVAAIDFEKAFLRLSPRRRQKFIDTMNPQWSSYFEGFEPVIASSARHRASELLMEILSDDDPQGGMGVPVANLLVPPTLGGQDAKPIPTESETNYLAIS
jgi:predicted GIY-YIG superfamily endonuclease